MPTERPIPYYAAPSELLRPRPRLWPSLRRFYGHFAAAYGTCWFIVVALAFLTQNHIDTGLFGLVGFPALVVIYATARMFSGGPPSSE